MLDRAWSRLTHGGRLADAAAALGRPLAVALLAPGAVVINRWKERARGRVEPGTPPGRDADADDETERLAAALARAASPLDAAAALFDALERVAGVDASLLALVDEDERRATGFAARGADERLWRDNEFDLDDDPAGVATAARERAPFAVYDLAAASDESNRALAASVGAKSAAFVPLLAGGHLVGVLVLATTAERRFFAPDDLAAVQSLANEAAPVLATLSSADALRAALAREKLVADIARKVRSELDLDAVLEVAVTETGRALGVGRCFIRLGAVGEPMPLRAEWTAAGVEPIAGDPTRLAVTNLALREGRTVVIPDIAAASELDELGGREPLLALSSRSAVATPIVVFGRTIGVFTLHRAEPGPWFASDVSVAEAVAGEIGIALHAARLLRDDERRLEQQAALLKAAQVVTSDLRFESVLRRLVDEVATLFNADAADCWMFEENQRALRCRAVYGLPQSEVGRRIAPEGTFAHAIETGRPVLKRDFARTEDPPPSASFAGFEEVMVAPITWLGEVRGVLGVCTRKRGCFDDSQLELLDAFGRFASLASNNAESFEERERQAQVQQGFFRIAEVLGSPLSLTETLDALAQAAAEALGGESAVVLTPDGSDTARLAGSHDVPPGLAARLEDGLPASATPFPAAAQEERIVSSTSLEDDDRFDDETRALLAAHGYHALLSAPVQRRADNASVVVLFRAERTFSDDDLALARHLSRAARGALERSEFFEAERRARSLSQRLATVGARLVTNLDPTVILDEVATEAPLLLDADGAAVRLLEREDLVVRAASGTARATLGSRGGSGAGLLGDLAQSRRPVTVDDARATPQAARSDPVLADSMAACVAVPMIAHGGGLHGVLSVYAAAPRGWRDDEVQALVALAAMASAALSNAALYQRVAEEKERSDAILANVADGIVAVDRDGRIVLWNARAEQITGVPAAEALGRRVTEALQRELASEESEPVGEREISIMRGGKEVWLSLTEAVMRDAAGGVLGRIFAFRDVSGEHDVEQIKSDFVATVSHELRTPLTSIYGFAETLLRRDVAFGEDDRATFLGYIASESERLIRIVDDLLNVARLEAGTLGLSLQPTDVAAVVSEVVESVRPGADGRYRLIVDFPEGPLYAEADPPRLAEVVHHLLDNAVKYSPEGGTITVSGRRTADTVEVRVVDEGVGIAHGDRQRIFTKFFRGDVGRLGPPDGTGIGLFLARGLVAGMNGRIWVESLEGEGSSFVFELPVSNVALAGMGDEGAAAAALPRPTDERNVT